MSDVLFDAPSFAAVEHPFLAVQVWSVRINYVEVSEWPALEYPFAARKRVRDEKPSESASKSRRFKHEEA